MSSKEVEQQEKPQAIQEMSAPIMKRKRKNRGVKRRLPSSVRHWLNIKLREQETKIKGLQEIIHDHILPKNTPLPPIEEFEKMFDIFMNDEPEDLDKVYEEEF